MAPTAAISPRIDPTPRGEQLLIRNDGAAPGAVGEDPEQPLGGRELAHAQVPDDQELGA